MSDTKRARTEPQYELLYHNGIPGRAEPIRLAFEQAGADYVDVCRESDPKQMYKLVGENTDGHFAPPLLRLGDQIISQSPAILHFLGPRLGLAPDDEFGRAHLLQLTLTAFDLQQEAHDVHHPIAVAAYYEEQKDEALKKAKDVRNARIPKFLGVFERALKGNIVGKSEWLYGSSVTYADLSLAFVISGLLFAFPKAMASAKGLPAAPLVQALHDRVHALPRIKAYLESDRRIGFSSGVYRHYPELDAAIE